MVLFLGVQFPKFILFTNATWNMIQEKEFDAAKCANGNKFVGLKFGDHYRGQARLNGLYNFKIGSLLAIKFQGFNVVGEVVLAMRSFKKVIGFGLGHEQARNDLDDELLLDDWVDEEAKDHDYKINYTSYISKYVHGIVNLSLMDFNIVH